MATKASSLSVAGMRRAIVNHGSTTEKNGQPYYKPCRCAQCERFRAAIAKATGDAS